MEFEWDLAKAAANLRKHKVSFTEAASVLGNEIAITVPDPDHSKFEDRFITLVPSNRGRLLMVAHTDRSNRIRIINARAMTRAERKAYEEASN